MASRICERIERRDNEGRKTVSASSDIERFRIDESGYTGFDFLNLDHRFQGASAIAISDDDAARLIKQHLPRLQASKLKYRTFSRRPVITSRCSLCNGMSCCISKR
ncbi:hypothetical protein [Bradyrhizobium sp. CCBAU 53421]|uniref:hypothetical protein n=1 Tax=Bradyrhizobium sp. CCBAU 53421 TaxID=1325120 RepID=UPI001AEF0A67|nr:hypothetical protein [Bradyrhizobium sp. CCBAU 53421]